MDAVVAVGWMAHFSCLILAQEQTSAALVVKPTTSSEAFASTPALKLEPRHLEQNEVEQLLHYYVVIA